MIQSFAVPGPEAVPILVNRSDRPQRETLHRVRSAIESSGFRFPVAVPDPRNDPSRVHDHGGRDLAYALACLGEVLLPTDGVWGGLNLDGTTHPEPGAVAVAETARDAGVLRLYVPYYNAAEAASVPNGPTIIPISALGDLVAELRGDVEARDPYSPDRINPTNATHVDFANVRGQHEAKDALETASAEGRDVLLIGPPGSGKTLLARAFPSILPTPTEAECVETTRVHSVAGLTVGRGPLHSRPFRGPHHTASTAAMVGGGRPIRPGEVSLAHNGVLFLNDATEFPRTTLEALGAVLADGEAWIGTRPDGPSGTFPARCTVVAAVDPCPCGHRGDETRKCRCKTPQLRRWQHRVDMLRRILRNPVEARTHSVRRADPIGEDSSEAARMRVYAKRGQ